ncbi:hypothetical protein RBB75_12690 [Tunturibacter empetritectus]|uniref:Uncharacterized protein n=1 Tax=Tunturiibacter empetritectus TaxID=3069691 RepID=A0AAU7Z8Q3_9BACT
MISLVVVFGIGFVVGIQYSNSLPELTPQTSSANENGTVTNEKENESYWDKIGKPEVLPVWLAMLITGAVGYIALRTLGDIKKQTRIGLRSSKAATIAANASLKSVDIAAVSGRAWVADAIRDMECLPEVNGKIRTYITLKNWGKVPALVVDLKIRFHTFGIEGLSPNPVVLLPANPTYDAKQVILELGSHGVILAPDQEVTVAQDFEEDSGKLTVGNALLINSNLKRLVCYGLVTYEDGFGQTRFTQFCHMWDKGYDPEGVIPNFRRLGPDYYNQAT